VNEYNTNLRTLFPIVLLAIGFLLSGCDGGDKANRPSPLVKDSLSLNNLKIKLEYSSPAVRERKIWDDLVPYYKVWRTGANEATIFESNSDLIIAGKQLPKGKYALFTIPGPEKWIVIFNKDWDQWGAFLYDGSIDREGSDDQLRIEIKPELSEDFSERMKITPDSGYLNFHWEYLKLKMPYKEATTP
jgi:hypothetical protein